MLKEKVEANPKVKGFIFDGFPRTLSQAKSLNRLMSKRGGISKLLMLDVPDHELIRRLLLRGKTSGRADDKSKSIIQNRLQVYKETTSPVFDFYMKKDCSVKVWGMGDMKLILDRLSLEIESVPGAKKLKPSTKKKTVPKKKIAKKTTPKSKLSAKKAATKSIKKKTNSKK
jgi:adenylate kinase